MPEQIDFSDPTAFTKDLSPKSQAQRFRAENPTTSREHKLGGGENLMVLVFRANQPVTGADAKQLATWVQGQRDELVQSGAMLADTMPSAEDFPDEMDVHLVTVFWLKPVTPPTPQPE